VKLKAPVGPAGAVTGGSKKAEKRGLASASSRVKPYRRRWTTLRLGRKLSPEEIGGIAREALNEAAGCN
jgi:hypothetical protein